MCECEFDPYDDSDEESWHFRRTCLHCGEQWWGLHCPHDGYQNPCPDCGIRPDPVPESLGPWRDELRAPTDDEMLEHLKKLRPKLDAGLRYLRDK